MPNPRVVVQITSAGRQRVAAEIRSLQREASITSPAQNRLRRETAAASRESARQAREVAAARRELLSLRSSLGGAERATSQLTRAQQRLNRARRAGVVDDAEAARLTGLMADRFSVAAVNARSLRGQLSGIREEIAATAALSVPGGQFLAGGLARGAIGGGVLGGAALAAGGVGVALAGEQRQQRRLQVEALGLDPAIIREVVDASLELGIAVDSNIDLIRRLALANDTLQRSEAELLSFTTRLNQAMAVSGTSGAEASAGVRQLGQALASGRLQGDEFRSIMENIPVVARSISRGLVEMGIAATGTAGELRELSTAGELTSERVFEAFMRGSRDVETAFAELPQTTSRSLRIIVDSIREAAGAVGEATGITRGWQRSWEELAETVRQAAGNVSEFTRRGGSVPFFAGTEALERLTAPRFSNVPTVTGEIPPDPRRREGGLGLRAVPFSGMRSPPPIPELRSREDLLRQKDLEADAAIRARLALDDLAGSAGTAARNLPQPGAPAGVARAQEQIARLGLPGSMDQLPPSRAEAMSARAAERGILPPRGGAAAARSMEEFERLNDLLDTVEGHMQQFTSTAADGLARVALEADNVGDAIDGMLRSLVAAGLSEGLRTLLNVGVSAAVGYFRPGAGGAGAGVGAGAAGGGGPIQLTPYFSASGLSGTVAGSGPADSRLFASMVSPGEHISITPAAEMRAQQAMMERLAQQQPAARSGPVVEIIDQRGAGAPPVEVQEEEQADGQRVIRAFIRGEARSEMTSAFRDGSLDQDMAAYGARRQPIRR